jgi:type III secretion system HrpE/YscL family protein
MGANIIKARNADGAIAATTIKKDVHDATLEAREIVSQARADAARMLEQTERERQAALVNATQEGYAAGLAQWNEILADAWRSRDAFIARSETELVRLAVRVSEKVIGQELKADSSAVLNTIREALKSVRRERNLTIHVNPEHESTVRSQTESLGALLGGVRELLVVANPSVAPGGCIVESEIGTIDAQLSTQLKALEQALLRKATQ